ncbi:two-component system activity regulator YycH [Evansella sp. AB-P1]|uniref:YycH family regulatory protein n=1 Tax=Evansella sp. AB-P1 TaxID=3037653 RepID=UPI00241C6D31|nr:two-component system activity regulator YycH [Evansella sp. AB-P1]MDG5789431.1 two-component system activity regulator YycH [Evansella sp. AB-P1]
MIEHMKTIALWILIILSVVLTMQIWTFQPDYEIIPQSDYFQSEAIGEERSIKESLKPNQIYIHEEDQSYWLNPTNYSYDNILENLQGIRIDYLYQGADSYANSLYDVEGIELYFPNRFKIEWVETMLDVNFDQDISLNTIDRFLLFVNDRSINTEVSIRLISTSDQSFYQGNTNLSINQLKTLYNQFLHQIVAVETNSMIQRNNVYERNYVPNESFELNEYSYFLERFTEDAFVQSLFSDPESVKHYSQGNQENAYTDGNRLLNIIENGDVLRYIHPSNNQRVRGDRSILEASNDFINGHSGWTDDYRLDRWQEGSINDRAFYTLFVDGLPIMGSLDNASEHYSIQITRSGNQISEYVRPLFQLDENPFGTTIRTLPSFEIFLDIIEEIETVQIERVEDITIGYYMRKQGASLVIFEPAWFVKERGTWKHVAIPENASIDVLDREADQNGLE